jgi:predicted nucleotidyltransferase component of viral defense system
MLLPVWIGQAHRPTRDLDLLGYEDESRENLTAVFSDICGTQVEPDGIEFIDESIRLTDIRENQQYQGQRVNFEALLGNARIPLQTDIGFGDVVIPRAEEIEYPTLLDFPAPRIPAYSRESTIAEKLEAMVALGMPNSRMKDFYDVWKIAKQFDFRGAVLRKAITATFNCRNTNLPDSVPVALGEEFASAPDKVAQWRAFLQRTGLEPTLADFQQVIRELREFLIPPLVAAARGEAFNQSWTPGGQWSPAPTDDE